MPRFNLDDYVEVKDRIPLFLEDYPELFYMYGNEESPFNLEATVGGDERDKYMTVGGKFTFAEGGLATLMGY